MDGYALSKTGKRGTVTVKQQSDADYSYNKSALFLIGAILFFIGSSIYVYIGIMDVIRTKQDVENPKKEGGEFFSF